MVGLGSHVHDNSAAKEKTIHTEVGGAGGEDLSMTFPSLDPQNGQQDAWIGDQDQAEGSH
jgi:hypothetical protein